MALTGAIDGNVCYSTYAQAYAAHFHSIVPVILANGDTVSYQDFGTGVFVRVLDSAGGVRTTSAVPVPVFGSCDPLAGFNDGLALSAFIVTALALAVFWGIIARAR